MNTSSSTIVVLQPEGLENHRFIQLNLSILLFHLEKEMENLFSFILITVELSFDMKRGKEEI